MNGLKDKKAVASHLDPSGNPAGEALPCRSSTRPTLQRVENWPGKTSLEEKEEAFGAAVVRSTSAMPPPRRDVPATPTATSGRGGPLRSAPSTPAGVERVSPPPSFSSKKQMWASIEHYLLTAYTTFHDRAADQLASLKAPKQRMEWYAVIYNACQDDEAGSQELYTRLALTVLNALEAIGLFEMLQSVDPRCLRGLLRQERRAGEAPSTSPSSCAVSREGTAPDSDAVDHTAFHSAVAMPVQERDGHRERRPTRPSYDAPEASHGSSGLCEAFNREYDVFMTFQHVVLTAFRYLDQYYTQRLGMDSISVMCVKLFYVVVYETVQPLLVGELLELLNVGRKAQDNQGKLNAELQTAAQTIGILGKLWSVVHITFSFLVVAGGRANSPGTTAAKPSTPANPVVTCTSNEVGTEEVGESNSSRTVLPKRLIKLQSLLYNITAAFRGSSKRLAAASKGKLAKEGAAAASGPASPQVGTPLSKNDPKGSFPHGDEEDNSRGAGSEALLAQVDLRGVRELRSRLENDHLAPALLIQAVQCAKQQQQGTSTIIKEFKKPLREVVMDDFGTAYVERLEEFYRTEREQRLSTAEGRRGYVAWLQDVYEVEFFLIKDVALVFLHELVGAALLHVLVIEAHRRVMFDPENGFLALLEVWDGSRRDSGLVQAVLNREKLHAPSVETPTPAALPSPPPPPPPFPFRGGEMPGTIASGSLTATGSSGGPLAEEKSKGSEVVSSDASWGRGTVEELAIKVFFGIFGADGDESCLLPFASVLVSKLIRDCAARIQMYFSHSQGPPSSRLEGRDGSVKGLEKSTGGASAPRGGAATGDALVDELLQLQLRYTMLIEGYMKRNKLLLSAVADAMAEVVNPKRWSKSGALASSVLRARGATLLGNNPPSVLLCKDAASTATLPLRNLFASTPTVATLNFAVLLANYFDHMIVRRQGRLCSAATTSSVSPFAQIVGVVTLLDEKELFLEHHKALLVKRLLNVDAAAALDLSVEKKLVKELEISFGAGATYPFVAILHDFAVSDRVLMYFERTELFRHLEIPVHVRLFSSTQWLTPRRLLFVPHRTLREGMEAFQKHHTQLYRRRTLHWIHNVGVAYLDGEFASRPGSHYEITASALQTTILLTVSDACNVGRGHPRGVGGTQEPAQPVFVQNPPKEGVRDSARELPYITGEEIATNMEMPFSMLLPHLVPILMSRQHALLARLPSGQGDRDRPPSAPPQPTDYFVLNHAFVHKSQRFQLPMPRQRSSAADDGMDRMQRDYGDAGAEAAGSLTGDRASSGARRASEDHFRVVNPVLGSRRLQIDTALMRILKSRQAIGFQELLELVIEQLSAFFVPNMHDIKARLEELISRGFVKRNHKDHTLLEYLT